MRMINARSNQGGKIMSLVRFGCSKGFNSQLCLADNSHLRRPMYGTRQILLLLALLGWEGQAPQ